MRFDLNPHHGVAPLTFHMPQSEVEAILGAPFRRRTNRVGESELVYPTLTARFDRDSCGLVEISFLPGSQLFVDGLDVFGDQSAFNALVSRDGDPREDVGFVVLFRFGIAMTGFHDHDTSQLAVTAFCPPRWESSRDSMKPFLFPVPSGQLG